jgi:OHCU decarboxylase
VARLSTAPETNGRAEFIARYAGVFEGGTWVAEAAWESGDEDVFAAMERAVRGAPRPQRLQLIQAHPELGALAPRSGESAQEQATGLAELRPEELDELRTLNGRFRERFGFPFVICLRENGAASILDAARRRVDGSSDAEERIALEEVVKIARLRFEDTRS